MPISGPVVHQQLMDAYKSMQERLESARGHIVQSREQRDQLDDHRGEALVHLAEHYLPELTQDAIRQTWSEIRDSVSQVLYRKEDHARRVQTVLQDLDFQRQQQDQQLVSTTALLDQALEIQQELAKAVEQSLRGDSQFVALSDRAAIAEAALERAESNLEEIDQDSARKLPAYENSALFQYLLERGYGTEKYHKRGFTRRMDRMLAKFIDFSKAKQGYDFLRRTPEQMRQIIAEDRQALDTVMDELERRRDEVAEKLGLSEKIAEVSELQRQRDEQLNSLELLLGESEKAQREFADLDDTRGPYYREAIQLFRQMLERSDSRDLKHRAAQTPEITDDQIVARLMGVESEIGQLDASARRRRDELDQIQSFLEELGRLVQRFRAAQFDSSRSQFVGSLDVYEQVQRAQEDQDIEQLWQQIRRAQRWGPTAIEQVTSVAAHPLTQVLINAMAHAAGGAMQEHARRAGGRRARRGSSWSGSGSWGGGSSSGGFRRAR